jgi:hypothetical protein
MDNVSFHKVAEVQQLMMKKKIQYKYSGICQCPAAPVERVIGQIKRKFFKMMGQQRVIYKEKPIPMAIVLQVAAIAVNDVSANTVRLTWPSMLQNHSLYL